MTQLSQVEAQTPPVTNSTAPVAAPVPMEYFRSPQPDPNLPVPAVQGYFQNGDHRIDRGNDGLVKFRVERSAPDFGAVGWHAKTGQLLKHQQYYRIVGRHNLWNDPIHAGRDTWKCFHGPRLRTDAPLMEERDKQDKRDIDWARRKQFVNESRQETLERFYQRKFVNQNLENSSSWAPPYHAKREVCDYFDTFDNDVDALPRAAIKKILTPSVIGRDKDAVKFITANYEKEAKYESMVKEYQLHRQYDVRHDFYRRRLRNDELQRLSKQPVRTEDSSPFRTTKSERYSSTRVQKLAEPKIYQPPEDLATKIDYRGLVTADCRLALDILKPGSFLAATNFCSSPHRKLDEEAPGLRKALPIEGQATSLEIPVSPTRLTKSSGRHLHPKQEEVSSSQIMANVGSPAHKHQSRHLLETRDEQLAHTPRSTWGPGPRHGSYTYPMKVPESTVARRDTSNRLQDEKQSTEQPYAQKILDDFVPESAVFNEKIRSKSSVKVTPTSNACAETGFASMSKGFRHRHSKTDLTKTLNDDIAQFEQALEPQYVSHVGNYFKSDPGPVRERTQSS